MKIGYDFVNGKYVKRKERKPIWDTKTETEEKLKPREDRNVIIGSNKPNPNQFDIPAGKDMTDMHDNAYLRDNRLDITEKETISKIRAKRYKNKVENEIETKEADEEYQFNKKLSKKLRESTKLD